MAPAGHRGVDYLFFVYFLVQIPTTLLIDTQGVYPEWLYPSFIRNLRNDYLKAVKDPLMANAWHHPWFLSFCFIEHFLEVPFFFWAAYCYYYGALNKPRIIIPAIIYSTHVITAVIAIWATTLLADFSQIQEPSPTSFGERLVACSAYVPYFISLVVNLVDSFLLAQKNIYN